jgi:MFS family permease
VILLAALIVLIATVPLLGGRVARLGGIEFRRPAAGLAALVLQYTILKAFPEGDQAIHGALHLVSYALMFYFLAANLSLPGLWLIGLGGVCNALAIAANDGVMPAHPPALEVAGIMQVPGEFANSAAVADPKLWFLGDVFALPEGTPMANVFSIGDVLLLLGAGVLLHRVSNSRLAAPMGRLAAWVARTGPRVELVREQRVFRRLWIAQGISSIGDWVYPLAAYTLVIEKYGNTSSLAFLLIASAGPGMLVAIFGAPLIDRFSRKRTMFLTDGARGLALASLLLVGTPSLLHLYLVAGVIGLASSLNQPAFLASLPNILPKSLLPNANSLVAITMSTSIVVGMGIGGPLVETFGFDWGFAANAVSFFFSAALVAGTVMPRNVPAAAESMVRELRAGFSYVTGNRQILGVLVVLGLITLGAGLKSALEPFFAFRTLGEGATGMGLVNMIWGVGMLAGGFFAATVDRRLGHGPVLTWSTLIAGGCIVLASGSPSLAPVLVLWVVAGVANTLGTVAYETLVQEHTPDSVRGRVFAALEAAIQGGLIAGLGLAALAGALFEDDVAVRGGIAVAGLIFIMAGFASWRLLHARPAPAPAGDAPVAPAAPAFGVRGVKVLEGGPSLALLRVSTQGAQSAPVLLVDDGTRVHRVEALPGLNGGSFGYGVPKRLLRLRQAALALEVPGRDVVDLPLPG